MMRHCRAFGPWPLNFLLLLHLLPLAGCAPLVSPAPVVSREYSFDEVKLIGSGISVTSQNITFGRRDYTLDSEHRLLLRLVDLKSHLNAIRTGEGAGVLLQISTFTPEEASGAQASLQVCPVLANWMMLATWESVFPFGAGSRWTTPGGDFDQAECVFAVRTADRNLIFDGTRWFLNYPFGRRVNYGLILLTEKPVRLQGDASGSFSPRISWQE